MYENFHSGIKRFLSLKGLKSDHQLKGGSSYQDCRNVVAIVLVAAIRDTTANLRLWFVGLGCFKSAASHQSTELPEITLLPYPQGLLGHYPRQPAGTLEDP